MSIWTTSGALWAIGIRGRPSKGVCEQLQLDVDHATEAWTTFPMSRDLVLRQTGEEEVAPRFDLSDIEEVIRCDILATSVRDLEVHIQKAITALRATARGGTVPSVSPTTAAS